MKYNEILSDYNSEQQKSKDIQRVGNTIYNKRCGSNKDDQEAWLRLKEYLKRLENR